MMPRHGACCRTRKRGMSARKERKDERVRQSAQRGAHARKAANIACYQERSSSALRKALIAARLCRCRVVSRCAALLRAAIAKIC